MILHSARFFRASTAVFMQDKCRRVGIIGAARMIWTKMPSRRGTRKHRDIRARQPLRSGDCRRVSAQVSYVTLDARGTGGWKELKGKLRNDVVQAFYSRLPLRSLPISQSGCTKRYFSPGCTDRCRKPFGRDSQTAQALNKNWLLLRRRTNLSY